MYMSIAGLLIIVAVVVILLGLWLGFRAWKNWNRKARAAGYASLAEYLRAAPHTDEEKRQAVDLALKGLVLCILGLIFPPLLVIGLFPLFFGTRKMIYASLGLGLVDEQE